ncbi:PREDICTED: plasmolipin [Myotis brandtii]|uniref:plasmolipin n=1 Tax=Myotis brandtii TaxID=109478 RepID=UPI0007040AFD|nr:PREDICTED: plasmolipin [Myotis brandtii]
MAHEFVGHAYAYSLQGTPKEESLRSLRIGNQNASTHLCAQPQLHGTEGPLFRTPPSSSSQERVLSQKSQAPPLSCATPALGLLVWALIADTPYHLYPAYGWVMFVAVFLWLVTIVLFVLYLFQLHMKLYMVPWPLVLMAFNMGATVLYITAFITCSASVEQTSLKNTRPYNQRAAASFFSCLVMIAYGLSAFFSFQAWRGVGSNAATSQMAGGYA